jgi:hypothetical protein
MVKSSRDPSDPFAESSENRAQARARVAEAKKAKPKSRDDDDKQSGIRWGPIVFLVLIVGSSLLPGLAQLFESLGKLGFKTFAPDHQGRVTRFYQQHNPTKVSEVPNVMRKYKGREDALYAKLEAKYGIRP